MTTQMDIENAKRLRAGTTGNAVNYFTYDTANLNKSDLAKLAGIERGASSGGIFNSGYRDAPWQNSAQAIAQSNGDKELFLKLGGQVDPNDPWGFYRENAGNQLNTQFLQGQDPANFYRDKLKALSTGQFGPSDPSYAFRFQQGQQAAERSLASRGLLNSGNAALELQDYGQKMASTEYQAEYQRTLQGLAGVEDQYQTQFSRLSQMAGINLDPTGTDKIQTAQQGNAVQAQGNQLNYAAKMADISNNQAQWQDQLGMARDYDRGVGDALSKLSGANGTSNIYASYNS